MFICKVLARKQYKYTRKLALQSLARSVNKL